MKTLKEKAKAYEPKVTLNIADLDKVDLSFPVETREGITTKKDKEGKEFEETYTYEVMVVNEIEYRVPNKVLEEIKKMMELRSDLTHVKVTKTGEGVKTRYEVKAIFD